MKTRLGTVAALLLASASVPALGQGVPVIDPRALVQEQLITEHRKSDLALQQERSAREAEILEMDNQLISQLDRLIESYSLPPQAAGEMIEELEGGSGDGAAAAANLYAPDDNNPAASQTFGDAAVTVEEVIIAGSKATYDSAGVAKAGLSQAQWRALVQAMIWQESRFNPFIGSDAGAWGLTQLMPGTAGDMGVAGDYRTNPYSQVYGGAKYLSLMLNRHDGNIVLALAAYNAGPGNVDKYGGVPPFKETQHYVQVIPQKYNEYLAQIGGVDALGTIEPSLASGANFAIGANASAQYASHTADIASIAQRLKNIVVQMQSNENQAQAWLLNTYARAEMARIMALQVRLLAVQSNTVSLDAMQQAASAAEQRAYMQFSNE